jgi:hypothetical protein
MARASTLQLAVHDPDGLWPGLEDGFYAHMPLPAVEWTPPTRPTSYVLPPLNCAVYTAEDPVYRFPSLPVNWYRQPYVHLRLILCEKTEAWKRRDAAALRVWVDERERAGDEYLVRGASVYAVVERCSQLIYEYVVVNLSELQVVYLPQGTEAGQFRKLRNTVTYAIAEFTKLPHHMAGTTLTNTIYDDVMRGTNEHLAVQ